MSEFVVHFTRDGGKHQTAYDNVMDILYNGHLAPGPKPLGAAKNLEWLGDMRRAVCFSEVPLPYVARIARRRSQYGVGFTQEFVAARLGARVWCLDVGSVHEAVWLELQAQKEAERNLHDNFWGLAACVDRVGVFPSGSRYQFEWEREWRVVGPRGLDFKPTDVQFLFIPEHQHAAARAFFDSFFAQLAGPGFECPFLDPLWPPERVLDELERQDSP